MTQRLHDLNVFLEAIRYETQALEALSVQMEGSAIFDDSYLAVMDAYTQLRNLRTGILSTLDVVRQDPPQLEIGPLPE
ncbi:hypothetical protein [Deinococcus peraridilitoris]|uniref:Uncharacterized protein n=1 Tax=Deinococcus peraridilitoris (strain DSM 19664 / LMG 22246 / CIP 109416 / KR-200) TaxID=937777 RepID=L0A590_DEIPD|nr:hypothetical protein [Deinococcus peraridilitoris]AFZ68347.1 hypothetical protein Deipe_2886 [Deinococcus peraridilitoris DSM 19664]